MHAIFKENKHTDFFSCLLTIEYVRHICLGKIVQEQIDASLLKRETAPPFTWCCYTNGKTPSGFEENIPTYPKFKNNIHNMLC